jgi:hypothetical protein
MPKIKAIVQANVPNYALTTVTGAHHYRFVGVEFGPNPGVFGDMVAIRPTSCNSISDLPHHIVFDRVYIHGDPSVGGGRGIIMDGNYIALIDSYVSDIKTSQNDTQAVLAINAVGPLKIVNNYLEASGENVMFGGGEPCLVNQVPSDIEIRGNHFYKPLSWKGAGPPSGGTWLIKNHLELKLGVRVLVDGNVFENNWYGQGQEGYSVVMTPRNEYGRAPWAKVGDVTFTNNIVRRSDDGMAFSGRDCCTTTGTQITERVLIANNLFEQMNPFGKGRGRLFMVGNGIVDLTIEHNTAFPQKHFLIFDGSPDQVRMTYRNNLHQHGDYGLWGAGKQVPLGEASFTAYAPGGVFAKNVIIGPYPTSGGVSLSFYPTFAATNFFPSSVAQVGFVNYARGDYHLSAASPYKNGGTDAKDIGANIAALYEATGSVSPGGSRRASE